MGGFHFTAQGLLGDSLNVARVSHGTISMFNCSSPLVRLEDEWERRHLGTGNRYKLSEKAKKSINCDEGL